MNVLIVEDETSLAQALEHILQREGHLTDWVADGQSALDYARLSSYDLILLDVMLPKLDGFSVARQLRAEQNPVPVLMLTARTALQDKVSGLDSGADDYLTKPFEPEELLARVRAMTRRKGEVVLDELACGDLSLRLNSAVLCCKGKEVQLSKKEFDVLRLLMSNPQATVTKDALISHVWGMDSDAGDNNVEAYISFLRKKLRYLGSAVSIRNLQKIGYRLEGVQ